MDVVINPETDPVFLCVKTFPYKAELYLNFLFAFLYFVMTVCCLFYVLKHSPVRLLLIGCFWMLSLSWLLSSCLESDVSCRLGEPCAQTHRTDLIFVSSGVLSMRTSSWAWRWRKQKMFNHKYYRRTAWDRRLLSKEDCIKLYLFCRTLWGTVLHGSEDASDGRKMYTSMAKHTKTQTSCVRIEK